ncbi:MAG: hypothetical protein PHQ93_07930 [Sulfurimonas sp.]|uniref:hypothetical protein n=1 Tax=Sulfurimonas sp. TaxID=2022749 RepID=UPI00260611E7|nr:hypothetical protein [Sulfurimonas sp.]MDD5401098.1 hypothetical protein [Sulfurimonas sp.]
MSNDIKDIETIDTFENESEVVIIEDLTFENRTDRVSISGGIDITRDKIGLEKICAIKRQIDAIAKKLENEKELPDEIEVLTAKIVRNPFE